MYTYLSRKIEQHVNMNAREDVTKFRNESRRHTVFNKYAKRISPLYISKTEQHENRNIQGLPKTNRIDIGQAEAAEDVSYKIRKKRLEVIAIKKIV